jgi:hypothetical protein
LVILLLRSTLLATLLTALAGLLRLLAGVALTALLPALIILVVLSLLSGIALAAAFLALIGHRALLLFILVHFDLRCRLNKNNRSTQWAFLN